MEQTGSQISASRRLGSGEGGVVYDVACSKDSCFPVVMMVLFVSGVDDALLITVLLALVMERNTFYKVRIQCK